MMLLDRTPHDDRYRAQDLLREALAGYTRIGMRLHAEITQTLIDQAAS